MRACLVSDCRHGAAGDIARRSAEFREPGAAGPGAGRRETRAAAVFCPGNIARADDEGCEEEFLHLVVLSRAKRRGRIWPKRGVRVDEGPGGLAGTPVGRWQCRAHRRRRDLPMITVAVSPSAESGHEVCRRQVSRSCCRPDWAAAGLARADGGAESLSFPRWLPATGPCPPPSALRARDVRLGRRSEAPTESSRRSSCRTAWPAAPRAGLR